MFGNPAVKLALVFEIVLPSDDETLHILIYIADFNGVPTDYS